MSAAKKSAGKPAAARGIVVKNVSVHLGEIEAVAPVSFSVPLGGSAALVGTNGAGKTTLLRAVAGLVKTASGTVTVAGRAADDRDPTFRRSVATLLGPVPWADELTVLEHLTLIGVSWRIERDEARKRARTLLRAFEVGHLASRFPHELSSGQAQMLSLCVVLVRPSDVLLLDEPEQRLDDDRVATLVDVLLDRQEEGTTLLVATHDPRLVDALDGEVRLREAGRKAVGKSGTRVRDRTAARVLDQYRHRGTAKTLGERGYVLYVTVLVLLVVGAPIARAVVLRFGEPSLRADLLGSTPPVVLAAVGGALLAAAAALGPVRGPVVLPPFLTLVLAGSDDPRRRTLRRPFLVTTVVLALALVVVATIVGVPVAAQSASGAGGSGTSGSGAWRAVQLDVGAAALAVVVAVVWLAAQARRGRLAWIAAPAFALVTLVGLAWPAAADIEPGGWLAVLWPGRDTSSVLRAVALGGLLLLAVGASATVPRLLDRLERDDLLTQASRWQAATMSSATGDIGGALSGMRARPTAGRDLWVVRGRRWTTVIATSDLFALVRTPSRSALGVLGVVASGAGVAAAVAGHGKGRWALAAAVGVTLYAASGAFADGLRHAARASVGARTYGVDTRELVVPHLVAPGVVTLVGATVGAAGVAWGGAGSDGVGAGERVARAVVSVVLLTGMLLAVRLRDSAKGSPPAGVIAPTPTAMGDVSAVSMVAWQLDATILAAIAGLGVALVVVFGSFPGFVGLVAVAALLVAGFGQRLRKL